MIPSKALNPPNLSPAPGSILCTQIHIYAHILLENLKVQTDPQENYNEQDCNFQVMLLKMFFQRLYTTLKLIPGQLTSQG